MTLLLSFAFGLVVWIVVWSLGKSGLDSAMIAVAITLVGASIRILASYLPRRRS